MKQKPLSFPVKLAYSAPAFPMSMLHVPALSMLPALYAKYGAVDLATIGTILILTRLLDAFTDPIIGLLSDQTKSRLGSRKPWIIIGVIMSCIGVYFWFRPGPDTGWLYFMTWSIVVYMGWTLVEIPHSAWLSEISHDYSERSSLSSYRTVATYMGYGLFLSLPLWPIFPTTELTPQVTALASWFVIVLLPILAVIAIIFVPAGQLIETTKPAIMDSLRATISNIPLALYVGSALAVNLASGMVGGLYFFYLDNYLNILDKIGHIGLIVSVVSIISAAVSAPLIARFGKHRAIAASAASNILILTGLAFLQPGDWAFPGMLALFSLSALFSSVSMVASYALLADIIDYETLKSGKNRAGNFYALQALISKSGVAIGGGLGFLIISAFGFDPKLENDQLAMTGFFVSFIGVPALLYGSAVVLAWVQPIDRRRHSIIERRLSLLADRSQVVKSHSMHSNP